MNSSFAWVPIKLHDSFGLQNFDSSRWPNGWSHRLWQHTVRTSYFKFKSGLIQNLRFISNVPYVKMTSSFEHIVPQWHTSELWPVLTVCSQILLQSCLATICCQCHSSQNCHVAQSRIPMNIPSIYRLLDFFLQQLWIFRNYSI